MFFVTLITAPYTGNAYSKDIPTVEEGNMKQMSTSDLSARINRFKDRKKSLFMDLSELSDRKVKRSHRQQVEVSNTPFIALAIK
jgi:hypothetical protein